MKVGLMHAQGRWYASLKGPVKDYRDAVSFYPDAPEVQLNPEHFYQWAVANGLCWLREFKPEEFTLGVTVRKAAPVCQVQIEVSVA